MSAFAAQARKFLVALGALVGVLIANGLLADEPAKWVTGVIAALSAALVYYVPNSDASPDHEPEHLAE